MNSESKQAFFAVCGQSCVSVYANEREGAVIALYGNQSRCATPQVAISVGHDCVPRLQVATPNGLVIIDLAKTVQVLASLGTLIPPPLSGMLRQSSDRPVDLPASFPSACTPIPLQQTQPQPAGAA